MTTRPLNDQAIECALNQCWEESIKLNKQILADNGSDTGALLRLAFAYIKTGKYQDAKKTYEKIIKIDKYNPIALKHLEKLRSLPEKTATILPSKQNLTASMSPLSFLEDPGVTKITQCVHVAPQKTIAALNPGQEVFMKPKNHGIEIRDNENRYIAALPDDLSFKLLKMISARNVYRTFIKSIEKNCITLLVREISRGKKFANQPSFAGIISYHSSTREIIANTEKPEAIEATGDDDES